MQNKPFHLDKVAIRMVKEPPLFSEVPINSPQAAVKMMADTISTLTMSRPDMDLLGFIIFLYYNIASRLGHQSCTT